MLQYKKYLVKDTDRFDPEYFSGIQEDLLNIKNEIAGFPSVFKAEILVAYLKKHEPETAWKVANPKLTDLINSNSLSAGNIESLFESSANNAVFKKQLEEYLTETLSG